MQDEDNQHSHLGSFWLPHEDEAKAVSGVMDLSEEGASVRLHGALTESGLLADAVVFARLQGHYEKATLFNCFASASRKGDGTVVSSKLSSTLVALGTLRKDLGGHTVQFRLPGSTTWFHEQCFDVDIGDASEVVVRFKAFESTHYPLPGRLMLERFFSATVPFGNWGTERFETRRPMGFRISSVSRLDFDGLWEQMFRLRRFLEFLSQHHMPHTDLAIYDEADIEHGQPDIKIGHSSLYVVKSKGFEWDEQLVLFDDIRDRFSELLRRWFEIYQAHPEPFSRYFAAFDHDRTDTILHFLWNVAALEELHKLRTTRLAKQEVSLMERLQDIRARWGAAFSVRPSDEVLRQIKDSRHYYAHAAGDLRDKAVKDWALLRYGDFLAALSSLEIMALLGFSEEEAIKLTNRYWIQEILALKKYPHEAPAP